MAIIVFGSANVDISVDVEALPGPVKQSTVQTLGLGWEERVSTKQWQRAD